VELAHASAQDALFRSLIAIYRSMGGGWIEKSEGQLSEQPVKEAGFVP
jgi:outer membrane protein TolC